MKTAIQAEESLFDNVITIEHLESRLELANTASKIHISIEIEIEL